MFFNGIGPLGCIPSQRVKSNHGTCLKQVNMWVQEFNSKVQKLVKNLNWNLPSAQITFADIYQSVLNLIENPTAYGKNIFNFSFFFFPARTYQQHVQRNHHESFFLVQDLRSPTHHAAMWIRALEGFVCRTQTCVKTGKIMCFGMLFILRMLQIKFLLITSLHHCLLMLLPLFQTLKFIKFLLDTSPKK